MGIGETCTQFKTNGKELWIHRKRGRPLWRWEGIWQILLVIHLTIILPRPPLFLAGKLPATCFFNLPILAASRTSWEGRGVVLGGVLIKRYTWKKAQPYLAICGCVHMMPGTAAAVLWPWGITFPNDTDKMEYGKHSCLWWHKSCEMTVFIGEATVSQMCLL